MKQRINLAKLILIIYSAILIWVVLFKASISFEAVNLLKNERVINLIPFYWGCNIGKLQIRETVFNIAVFAPLGVYLKMLGIHPIKTVSLGFGLSILFEACQYGLAIGVCDITDIINNTLGAAIGVLLYVLLGKIFSEKALLDRIINFISTIFLIIIFALALMLFINKI